jgi:hypothetical protein
LRLYREADLDISTGAWFLARGMEGKFVVCALTGDKTDPPYAIRHFRSGGGANEMEQMAYFIRSFCPSFGVHPDRVVREPWTAPNGKVKTYPSDCRCKPLNLYIPWAVFRPDLEDWKKGSEADVLVSLAGVVDLDCDKGDSPDFPLKASGRLETSWHNYQHAFVWDRPLPLAEAKPAICTLHRLTFKQGDEAMRCDSTTKDVSHIWRVPGTLNFPHAEKIARRKAQGIPTEPFVARWVSLGGGQIDPSTVIAAAPPELPRVSRSSAVKPSIDDDDPLVAVVREAECLKLSFALEALNPDVLPKTNPPATLRAFWLEVGMALHDWDEGWCDDKGKDLFVTWSRRSRPRNF